MVLDASDRPWLGRLLGSTPGPLLLVLCVNLSA